MKRAQAYGLIDAERERQDQKWDGKHAHGWGSCAGPGVESFVKSAVLAEECGEVARALLDGDPDVELRTELVQVAAVAIAWLESM